MCERNGFFADPLAENVAGFLFICCKSTVDTLQSDFSFSKADKTVFWYFFFYKELLKIKNELY